MNKINDLLANVKMAIRQNSMTQEDITNSHMLNTMKDREHIARRCNYVQDALLDVEKYLIGVLENEK